MENYKCDTSMSLPPGIITELVCSVFSGFDLLGKGFEENGFCVVGGVDIIFERDIRNFHPPPNKFNGIIGGSPCQDFSKLRRVEPTGYGLEMISEFKRIVLESNTDWFLLENVPQVPDIVIENYQVQRFSLSPTDLGFNQSRRRHFQFGSKTGRVLSFSRKRYTGIIEPCLTASNDLRSFEKMCEIQGMDFVPKLSEFKHTSKKKLIGNSVHFGVARAVARAVRDSADNFNSRPITELNFCLCGCGEILEGNKKTKTASCRKRMQYKRNRDGPETITPRTITQN